MLSQFTQVAIILILAVAYIRIPVLAQNETSSSNSSQATNASNNGTNNGAGCIFPMEHTVILLTISGAASLLNTMLIH